MEDPSEPTHGLVIQEDAIVCHSFPLAVEQIAEAKPSEPVVLFLSWLPRRVAKEALLALKRNQRYVRIYSEKFVPVVAVLWPLTTAERFLSWAETARLPGHPGQVRSDDACLAEWVRRKRETMWVTVPSLVEHPDTVDSVKGRNNAAWGKDRGRVALSFIGERDPLEFNWIG